MPTVATSDLRTRRPLGIPLARAALRVPLAVKLAGSNAVVVLVAAAAIYATAGPRGYGLPLAAILGAALLAGVLVNVLLVRTALGPLHQLEQTAAQVVAGNLGARAPRSPLADPEMARVGAALNAVLDALGAERERVRALAAEVIRSSDADRARVARELHDSVAQTLAALTLQAGSAARRVGLTSDRALAEQVELVRELSVTALEEVRALSYTVHPRILDDLGLTAALEQLASAREATGEVKVTVEVDGDTRELAPAMSATLYRLAEEAIANAVCHAGAKRIQLRLAVQPARVGLEVVDDGRGFTPSGGVDRRPGLGLFVMQERAALLDGRVRIESAPGRGTRVAAEFPFGTASNTSHPEAA